MLALPIFPGSHPPSIVGACELNFCVRDGNRWDPFAIITGNWMAFCFAFLASRTLKTSYRFASAFIEFRLALPSFRFFRAAFAFS